MRVCVIINNKVDNIIVVDDGAPFAYPLPHDILVPDPDSQRCIGDTYDPKTGTFASIYDVADEQA
jgi:hypothetical protein